MENKRTLSINTTAGILDIILAIVSLIALPLVLAEGLSNGTTTMATFFWILMAVGLALHIVGLNKSRKAQISIVGHILGIVGTGLYLGFGVLLSFPSLVLLILASIFTLMQKNK